MGVVDDNGVGRRYRHHLHPALDTRGRPEGGDDPLHADAQIQGAGDNAQGVIDGKSAGDGQEDPADGIPGHRVELHMAGIEPQVLGHQVGQVPPLGVGENGTGNVFGVPSPRLVVQVEDGQIGLVEEQALCVPVGLHGTVVVQMVLSEVGEDPGGEADTEGPPLVQSDGGGLHHHMGTAGSHHGPEQGLELIGLRGGAAGGEHTVPDQVLVGADEAHLGSQRTLQHRLQEIGGGGLAVGAGDSHTGELFRRMAEPVGGDQSQGGPGVLSHQPGTRKVRFPAAEYRRRSLFKGLGDEVLTVGLVARQGREEVPRRYGAGVVADAGDLRVIFPRPARQGHSLQQLLQSHDAPPSLNGCWRCFRWRRNPAPRYP